MVGENKYEKRVTLPNGEEVSNYSKTYMLWCEAINLQKKTLQQRRDFLEKIHYKRPDDAEKIKKYLRFLWSH
jgi:predicted ATP-dependent Lon-type protease